MNLDDAGAQSVVSKTWEHKKTIERVFNKRLPRHGHMMGRFVPTASEFFVKRIFFPLGG